jgi:hypothetical protein
MLSSPDEDLERERDDSLLLVSDLSSDLSGEVLGSGDESELRISRDDCEEDIDILSGTELTESPLLCPPLEENLLELSIEAFGDSEEWKSMRLSLELSELKAVKFDELSELKICKLLPSNELPEPLELPDPVEPPESFELPLWLLASESDDLWEGTTPMLLITASLFRLSDWIWVPLDMTLPSELSCFWFKDPAVSLFACVELMDESLRAEYFEWSLLPL